MEEPSSRGLFFLCSKHSSVSFLQTWFLCVLTLCLCLTLTWLLCLNMLLNVHASSAVLFLSDSITTWGWKLFPNHFSPLKLTYLNCTALQLSHWDILLFNVMRDPPPHHHPTKKPKNKHLEHELLTTAPPTQLSHLCMNSKRLSFPTSHCTKHPKPPPLCLSSTTAHVVDIKYISFLDLTYNQHWSHVVSEEHSDVPVNQTSCPFCTYSLT